MTQIGEYGPGMLQPLADGAEKLPALEARFASVKRLRFSHGSAARGKMLLLF
jgi:hypothetical protein